MFKNKYDGEGVTATFKPRTIRCREVGLPTLEPYVTVYTRFAALSPSVVFGWKRRLSARMFSSMRRRSRRGPNTSESTGKIGQELPSNQPAPLVPLYPDEAPSRSPSAARVQDHRQERRQEPRNAQPPRPHRAAAPDRPTHPERTSRPQSSAN